MSDANENELRLATCASKIKQLESDLARGGPERLEAHRQIGEELLHAKEIDPKTFASWCRKTFGRGPQWRATHMTLARRWDDLMEARTWAEGENSKLAEVYSVDGVLELLDAWSAAKGQDSSKRKRSLPKEAKTSDEGDLCIERSPEQREIAMLRQLLQDQSDEAAHFRLQLPVDIRSEARALAVRVRAHDSDAERQLRDIAREHRWLFRDLFDDLGGDSSGGPELSAQHSSSETPLGDEESAASTTGETFADAPKSEEYSSDEAGAEREDGDFKGASIAPAAAPDTLGASPRLEDERPQGDEEVHAAKLGKAAGAKPLPGWKPPPKLRAAKIEGGHFKPCNPFDAQLADAEL